MDNKKKIRKHAPTSSSSSDESSSSTSSETHRKQKHRSARKQRDSSSSSEEEVVRKSHKHHKKSSSRKHSHSAKIRAKMLQANAKKAPRSMSPTSRAALKHHLRAKLAKKAKQIEEHDRHAKRSRSPTRRDVKKDRTPEHRIASPNTRIRVSVPNNRVQERNRSAKDSPSTSRRHVREAIDRDRGDMLVHQKERDKMRRMHEEEHYKYVSKTSERPPRVLPASRGTPENAHSHDRVPIRDRLEKDYEYRRSISREHDEYSMMRGSGSARDNINVDRSFEYRSDERRHEYSQSRLYDERGHHRGPNWEETREPEVRGNRMYESNWESSPHERKRIPPDEPPYKERQWSDKPHEKWQKEKEGPEWNRNWKESHSSPQIAPTMPHPRRWPGPSQMSDSWSPRNPHPPHKIDSHPSGSAPPFKPRGSPFFGFKRFPYKRFPNQYSKINFPSKRVLPSAPMSAGSQDMCKQSISENMSDSAMMKDEQDEGMKTNESGEISGEMEEEKIAPDTTFSGNIDQQFQEECEGNLSDFSDADDGILNREEIDESSSHHMDGQIQTSSRAHSRIAYVNNRIFSPFSSDYYCIYGLLPRHTDEEDGDGKSELARANAEMEASNETPEEQNQNENEQKMISKIHANKELKKEMDLDFEEISDGELEEESRIKGLGDALGVDWASLAKETQRSISRPSEEFYNSTKSRWTAHRILWDVGISAKLAGDDFARHMLTNARSELKREKQEWLSKKLESVKTEEILNGDIKKEKLDEVEIKIEPKEEEEETSEQKDLDTDSMLTDELEDFELDNDVLLHPIAQVQVLMRKLAIKRRNLILHSSGKFGRALSARRDLKLRRQLCNLPAEDLNVDKSCLTNVELIKNADEVYRKLIGEVN